MTQINDLGTAKKKNDDVHLCNYHFLIKIFSFSLFHFQWLLVQKGLHRNHANIPNSNHTTI